MQKVQKIQIGIGLLIVAAVCFITASKEPHKRNLNIAVGSACLVLGAGFIKFRQSPDTTTLKISRR
jgi:DMSO reductase anchor subunit